MTLRAIPIQAIVLLYFRAFCIFFPYPLTDASKKIEAVLLTVWQYPQWQETTILDTRLYLSRSDAKYLLEVCKTKTCLACSCIFPNHSARVSMGNHITGNILGDKASCTDDHIVPDSDPSHNNSSTAYPDIIADGDRFCQYLAELKRAICFWFAKSLFALVGCKAVYI
jgi:hypothetical protein